MLPNFTNLESLLGGGSTAPTMPGPVAAEPMPAARPDLPRPGGGGEGFDWKKLLPMLPAIMGVVTKDGGVAAEAFRRGAERRRLEQTQQEEVSRRTRVEKQTAETRESATKRQALLDERAVLQDAAEELNGITDPNLYETALARHEAMAQRFGLPAGSVSRRFAFNSAGATAASSKAAADRLESLRKAGYDLADEKVVNGLSVPFQGKQVPVSDLLVMAGAPTRETPGLAVPLGMRGGMTQITPAGREPVLPTPKPKENAVNAGSFEDYTIRFAKDRGKTVAELTSGDLEEARKRYQQADDRPRITIQNGNRGGDLPPRVLTMVNTKASAFDRQPIVKKIQLMAESVAFADSLDVNTKSPADDQALIYAFAKAMDPDSVVREGEYATVQKYAQDWLSTFGFNASRVVSNTEILKPAARAQLKATIRQKYQSALPQYQNVRRSYVSQINRLTKSGDGEDYLVDYAAGFPDQAAAPESAPGGGFSVQTPDGQTFRFDTQAQLDAFKKRAGIQ